MNIYFESGGLLHNNHVIVRCCQAFRKQLPIHFHILAPKGISALQVFLLINGRTGISGVTVHTNARKLTPLLVAMANSSKAVELQIQVDGPLSKGVQRKLAALTGPVRIQDETGLNEEFYRNQRQILTDLYTADIYQLAAWGRTVFQCKHTSCIGKTLYISRKGQVSCCPKYIEESRIGTLKQLEDVFESDRFRQILLGAIGQRKNCKENCRLFEACKGGCPMEGNCESFREHYLEAVSCLETVLQENIDLRSLPYHQELAVLRRLCDMRKEPVSVSNGSEDK